MNDSGAFRFFSFLADMSQISHCVTLRVQLRLASVQRCIPRRPCPTTSTTPVFRHEQDFTCNAQQRSQHVLADLRSNADRRM